MNVEILRLIIIGLGIYIGFSLVFLLPVGNLQLRTYTSILLKGGDRPIKQRRSLIKSLYREMIPYALFYILSLILFFFQPVQMIIIVISLFASVIDLRMSIKKVKKMSSVEDFLTKSKFHYLLKFIQLFTAAIIVGILI